MADKTENIYSLTSNLGKRLIFALFTYLLIIITIVIEIGTLAEPEDRLAPGVSPLNTCPFPSYGTMGSRMCASKPRLLG